MIPAHHTESKMSPATQGRITFWRLRDAGEVRTARVVRGAADGDQHRHRAVGYSFNSEKIFCNKDGEVTRVPIVEHVPPDAVLELRLGARR